MKRGPNKGWGIPVLAVSAMRLFTSVRANIAPVDQRRNSSRFITSRSSGESLEGDCALGGETGTTRSGSDPSSELSSEGEEGDGLVGGEDQFSQ